MLVCSKHCGLVFTKDSYKTDMKLFNFATHTMFDSTIQYQLQGIANLCKNAYNKNHTGPWTGLMTDFLN